MKDKEGAGKKGGKKFPLLFEVGELRKRRKWGTKEAGSKTIRRKGR